MSGSDSDADDAAFHDAGVAGRAVAAMGCAAAARAARVSTDVAGAIDAAGGRGSVLAVHRSAVNLVFGPAVVTLVDDAAGGLPGAITIRGPFSPRADGVTPGASVSANDGEIRLGSAMRVDLRDAEPWSPVLGRMTAAPTEPAARLKLLREAAARQAGGFDVTPTSPGPTAAATRWISSLTAALGSGDDLRAGEAGEHLIGLGPGLTPSGDDLLVGVAAALFATGDPRAARLAGHWAAAAHGRTTPVAVAYLRHAAGAAFAERLHDLLWTILLGTCEGIAAAVDRAGAWGATSGADTVRGVSLALAAILAGRLPREIAA